jgi:hypothetical protein
MSDSRPSRATSQRAIKNVELRPRRVDTEQGRVPISGNFNPRGSSCSDILQLQTRVEEERADSSSRARCLCAGRSPHRAAMTMVARTAERPQAAVERVPVEAAPRGARPAALVHRGAQPAHPTRRRAGADPPAAVDHRGERDLRETRAWSATDRATVCRWISSAMALVPTAALGPNAFRRRRARSA